MLSGQDYETDLKRAINFEDCGHITKTPVVINMSCENIYNKFRLIR